jgi:polyphosphate kinase 2 (PPK2 family)
MYQKKSRKKGFERIEMKEKKHWKHKDAEWDTREKFDEYLAGYERIINNLQ